MSCSSSDADFAGGGTQYCVGAGHAGARQASRYCRVALNGGQPGNGLRVFFITGASIGVIGSLAGFGLGVVFCAYIEEIRQLLVMITGAQLFPAEVYFLERMPRVW